jgi:hypothetical protein
MRVFMAVLAVAILTVPASGQGFGGKHRRGDQKTDTSKTKVDEKAYESSLKSLPDQSFDPWHNMRDTPQAKVPPASKPK